MGLSGIRGREEKEREIVGTIEQYPSKAAALKASEGFRLIANPVTQLLINPFRRAYRPVRG